MPNSTLFKYGITDTKSSIQYEDITYENPKKKLLKDIFTGLKALCHWICVEIIINYKYQLEH